MRAELGVEHGCIQRVATQLGYGAESVRKWVAQADVVVALESDRMTVAFDGIGPVVVPETFIDGPPVGLDHAYALTSYAVQGSTHPVSTSRIDPSATRAETYVDITRGRAANHLYLTQAPDLFGGESLPKAPPAAAEQAALHCLERSRPELTAYELAAPDRSPSPRPDPPGR